ncbi:MAG: molybdenum cofactor biosynthesis protein C [candidate division Zixibacteria bacterium RBG_16_53_22]|nr:MAG: molybdenum cofactor biosynthesis protein C [candidate division Zixibacteria bacterium RBG_16_53_22]
MSKKRLTHINDRGKARMVDISGKRDSKRTAIAEGRVVISPELLHQLKDNTLAKGDALAVARVAGIQAAKRTADLIPLCHPLPLSSVEVDLRLEDEPPAVVIISKVSTTYKTGVEMEALTVASVAALTIYDMGKAVDKGMTIENIRLLEKRGGKSGHWKRR